MNSFSGILAATTATARDPLVPLSAGWIAGFLLLVMWLFVAAIILGPLIRHFKLEPRSGQIFADDRAPTGPRRH